MKGAQSYLAIEARMQVIRAKHSVIEIAAPFSFYSPVIVVDMREIKFRGYMNKDLPDPFMYYFELMTYDSENMPLNDAIIMQYTGLKDENGKKIYEGDIVKTTFTRKDLYNDLLSVVTWSQELLCFTINNVSFVFGNYHLEVIGNIYENPELLKS